jgi:hypothetical protein
MKISNLIKMENRKLPEQKTLVDYYHIQAL